MTEVELNTPTERALYRDCEVYKAERDRLRSFVEWVAAHKLVKGIYADEEHPYTEWVTPDDEEYDFEVVHARAQEVLRGQRT